MNEVRLVSLTISTLSYIREMINCLQVFSLHVAYMKEARVLSETSLAYLSLSLMFLMISFKYQDDVKSGVSEHYHTTFYKHEKQELLLSTFTYMQTQLHEYSVTLARNELM